MPIVNLLAKKCDVRQVNDSGWNGLHYACQYSSAKVVQLLLNADQRR